MTENAIAFGRSPIFILGLAKLKFGPLAKIFIYLEHYRKP